MSEADGQTGGCLCGKVRYRIARPAHEVVACHCAMCRRWSGGVLFTVDCEKDDVNFEGEAHIARYGSSDWAERGFCRECGSGLFYQLKETGQYIISAGTLDDATPLSLHMEFFVEEKPGFYAFANETRKLTGEEVFALFAPSDGDRDGATPG